MTEEMDKKWIQELSKQPNFHIGFAAMMNVDRKEGEPYNQEYINIINLLDEADRKKINKFLNQCKLKNI